MSSGMTTTCYIINAFMFTNNTEARNFPSLLLNSVSNITNVITVMTVITMYITIIIHASHVISLT